MASPPLFRRNILHAGAALAAASILPRSRIAAADEKPRANGRKLIVAFLGGGWDTTYVLDPKPGLSTIDVPAGDVAAHGGIDIFAHPSRPNVTAFFDAYGASSAIVNGIQMRAINHPECTLQILTGTRERGAPDFAAIAANELGSDLPLPYLVGGAVAFVGPYAASAGRVGQEGQLLRVLDPASARYTAVPGATPPATFIPSEDAEKRIAAFVRRRAERLASERGRHGENKSRMDDFLESLDRGARLKTRAKDLRGFASALPAGTTRFEQQLVSAVTAIESGAVQCVAVSDTQNWDTHAGNASQSAYVESVFGSLKKLATTLEERNLFDRTTVVVVSEMGRTPKLNSGGGKDHWPVTSALLFGAGVKGGRAYGRTTEHLEADFVDYATGERKSDGARLGAESFVAGALTLLGVDAARVFPATKPFTAFVK